MKPRLTFADTSIIPNKMLMPEDVQQTTEQLTASAHIERRGRMKITLLELTELYCYMC